MRLRLNCRPISRGTADHPLVAEWDSEAGTITGRDAELLRAILADGGVVAHPMPWGWTFGPEPLRSLTDMAAAIGASWHLPPELVPHYPKGPTGPSTRPGGPEILF